MKNAYKNLLVAVLITSSGGGMVLFGQTLGAMTLASYSEEDESVAGGTTTKFLNSCVVSLTKNMNACKLVVKKSSSPSLITLANKIIEDDAILLQEARALAAKLDVAVPYSSELNEEFNSNSPENEKSDIDNEFAKTAINDLEQIIEAFRVGAECDDRWTRAFAASNLSTLENHLVQIRAVSTLSR